MIDTIIFGCAALYGVYYLGKKVMRMRTRWQFKRALKGEYGDEVRWVAELIKEDDRAFIVATNNLTKMEKKEMQIIAESKEQLRERTIKRAVEEVDGLTREKLEMIDQQA